MTRWIRYHDSASPDLVDRDVESFLEALGDASLLRIPGRDRRRVRVVSTLLHGNEPSGLRALHRLLREPVTPAVDTVCFIGSVRAALAPPRFSHRHLPGEADLNRCFRAPFEGDHGAIASELLQELAALRPEALVDVHNTSSPGPSYSVVTKPTEATERLTTMFAPHMVLTALRLGALIEATEDLFPSLVVECGGAGDAAADEVALSGLRRYLQADPLFPEGESLSQWSRPEVFRHPYRVRLRANATLAFAPGRVEEADLTLRDDVDRYNFGVLEPGEVVGWLGPRGLGVIEAHASEAEEAERLFAERDGELVARRRLRPLMITTDVRIARSDCLFYVVEAPGL